MFGMMVFTVDQQRSVTVPLLLLLLFPRPAARWRSALCVARTDHRREEAAEARAHAHTRSTFPEETDAQCPSDVFCRARATKQAERDSCGSLDPLVALFPGLVRLGFPPPTPRTPLYAQSCRDLSY